MPFLFRYPYLVLVLPAIHDRDQNHYKCRICPDPSFVPFLLNKGAKTKAGSNAAGKRGLGMSSGSGGGGGGGNVKGGVATAASVVPTQTLNWRSTGIDGFIAEAMTEV